jgi:polar amino acid transport system substrate-binding protein
MTNFKADTQVPDRCPALLIQLCALVIVMGIAFFRPCPAAAYGEPSYLKEAVVVVGGGWDFPPYEFIDKAGQPAGFNVELIRAVAEVMGRQVEFRLGIWPEMLKQLETGEIDLLQGMLYTEGRARMVDFSNPHNNVNNAVFARRGTPALGNLDELRGKEIIVPRLGLMQDFLTQKGLGRNLILVDSPADALRMLASGKHDYAGVGLLAGIFLARELKLTNVVPVSKSLVSYPYCFAVRKGNAQILSDFNEGLAIVKKTGQYQKIYEKWLGVQDGARVTWKDIAKYALIGAIPFLLILACGVFWSRSLQKIVAQRTESLNSALYELQINQKQLVQADKLAAIGTLVSGVAHEINNPNGLILLSIPTLMKTYHDVEYILEEHYQEHGDFSMGGIPYSRMKQKIPRILGEMQDGAQRIKRIVHDLKDFARRDDRTEKELLDFNVTVQTAVRLADSSIRGATNSFQTDYGEALPQINGISQRLEQVVINLILNACQALPDPCRHIDLATYYDPAGFVVLRLKDQGVGIDPEHLSRVMDPFFTTKRDTGGTGLGLSVSAKIIRDHHGTLNFESIPGAGTTVTLAIAVAQEEQPT